MAFPMAHPWRDAFLANLLERVASRIVEQSEAFLEQAGIIFPPRAVSTVLLLGEEGPKTAADLARVLAQPHQLVTQRLELLFTLGVVSRHDDPADGRRRLVELTPVGEAQFRSLQAALARADAAFSQLFEEIGCNLTLAASKALDALDQRPLVERAGAVHA